MVGQEEKKKSTQEITGESDFLPFTQTTMPKRKRKGRAGDREHGKKKSNTPGSSFRAKNPIPAAQHVPVGTLAQTSRRQKTKGPVRGTVTMGKGPGAPRHRNPSSVVRVIRKARLLCMSLQGRKGLGNSDGIHSNDKKDTIEKGHVP